MQTYRDMSLKGGFLHHATLRHAFWRAACAILRMHTQARPVSSYYSPGGSIINDGFSACLNKLEGRPCMNSKKIKVMLTGGVSVCNSQYKWDARK